MSTSSILRDASHGGLKAGRSILSLGKTFTQMPSQTSISISRREEKSTALAALSLDSMIRTGFGGAILIEVIVPTQGREREKAGNGASD